MSEWEEKTLADISHIIAGYAFKGTDFSDEGEELVIKIKDIQEPFITTETATKVFIKNYSLPKLEKFKIKIGDFVIAMTGATIGKIGRYIDEGHAYINQRVAKFEAKEGFDKDFIYYLTQNPNFKNHILSNIDSQSAQGNISSTSIGRYKTGIPNLDVQQSISKVLLALDNKILNNRQMNETLEGMAQAIFKSWFVDFDPVKAKIAVLESGGSAEDALIAAMQAISGLSAEDLDTLRTQNEAAYAELKSTAEAFPYTFTDSPFGDIPEGWEVTRLGKIADLKQGKYLSDISDIQNLEYPYPVFGGGNVRGYVKTYDFEHPETLVTCRGSGCGLLQRSYPQSAITNSVIAIRPFKALATRSYIFYLSSLLDFLSVTTGSAQPQITISNLSTLDFVYAPYQIQKQFSDYVRILHKKTQALRIENQTLAETRDALLPKLLSGEIDVSAFNDMENSQ